MTPLTANVNTSYNSIELQALHCMLNSARITALFIVIVALLPFKRLWICDFYRPNNIVHKL